jgi:chromosome segregation ATPase
MNCAVTLDSALKERIRALLERQSSTEAELRHLLDEGRACSLILGAELGRAEQRLGELASDPTSSLAEIAAAYRDASELAPDLDELHTLIARLQERARELRASWLSTA